MAGPAGAITRKQLVAVCAGNALEFYEFLIYATFAVYIGRTFFPADAPGGSLLLSLATFGAGFGTRPIGGWVLGRYADRVGRKPAMLFSLGLMAIGMAGLALTPGYAVIGGWAPALVLAFRLLQGFALGGEVGPATAYLVEAAADDRRGYLSSFQGMSQGVAMLGAGMAGFALSLLLPTNALESWGWRLAMLPGLLVTPLTLRIRKALPETLHQAVAKPVAASRPDEPSSLRVIICGVLMLGSGTIGTYVASYSTTYALTTLHLSTRVSFAAGLVTALVILVVSPLSGGLSDRIGRKPVMVAATAATALVTVPAYWMIVHHPSPAMLFAMLALVALASSPATAPIIVAITEAFSPARRSVGLSCVYAVAIALFGGTTQFVITWLIQRTGDPLMPAYYRAAAALIGLGAALAMRETAPVRLRAAALAPPEAGLA